MHTPSTSKAPSILQVILTAIALIGAWGFAALMFAIGLFSQFGNVQDPPDSLPIFMTSASFFLAGLLLVPAIVFAILRLAGKDVRRSWRLPFWLQITLPLVVIPPALLLGNWVAIQTSLAWLLLPPLHILVVALPVWWIVSLGANRLGTGSAQRSWGFLSTGLVVAPLLTFVVEIGLFVLAIAALIVYFIARPEQAAEMEMLSSRILNAAENPEVVQRILAPIFLQPGVLFAVFASLTFIVALVEELLKPLGVWLLANRLTPAQGFVAGLLCGAGFAIFETLGFGSNITPESWWVLAVTRIGTGLLHTITTGLVGWALVSAWREGRFLRLGGAYSLAVLLHALWNFIAILTGFGPMAEYLPTSLSFLNSLSTAAPWGLGVLVVLNLAILLGANRFLRCSEGLTITPDMPAQTSLSQGT